MRQSLTDASEREADEKDLAAAAWKAAQKAAEDKFDTEHAKKAATEKAAALDMKSPRMPSVTSIPCTLGGQTIPVG